MSLVTRLRLAITALNQFSRTAPQNLGDSFDVLLTQDGDAIITQSGVFLVRQLEQYNLLTQDGFILITQDGDAIITQSGISLVQQLEQYNLLTQDGFILITQDDRTVQVGK